MQFAAAVLFSTTTSPFWNALVPAGYDIVVVAVVEDVTGIVELVYAFPAWKLRVVAPALGRNAYTDNTKMDRTAIIKNMLVYLLVFIISH